ncbi:MAG: hypothetical protein EBZ59_12460 [Planctomycetia bacterium]|nr:hypothetical protein [Planctomycetia bacterium]
MAAPTFADRLPFRVLLPGLLAVPLLGGCSTLLTAAYLLQPADVPAEFAGLKGKHVAVVCRPIVELEFSDAGSARELATLVEGNLDRNVRRVHVIGQQEVARWLDENAWVDYATLGKSLDADHVVGIDLERFHLHEGSTLYRGRASATIRVYDVDKGTVAFERRFDDFTFPTDSAIPAADRSESQFRAMFLQILAQKIARCFHAYESRDVFAEESLTF